VSALFAVVVVLANLLTVKLVEVPLVGWSIPCGLLLYPIVTLITNFTTEIYGKELARRLIFQGLAAAIFSTILLEIALLLPSADPKTQEILVSIFHVNKASIFSSSVAFLVGQLLDITLYCKIRELTNGRFLFLRNIGSSAVSQCVDTLIVNLLLFMFILEMPTLFVVQVISFALLYKLAASLMLSSLYSLMMPKIKYRLGVA
jgi:uncharacterized integral membrane protein (TIGR00697 family)